MLSWLGFRNSAFFALTRPAKWRVFRAWFSLSEAALLFELGLLLALAFFVAWTLIPSLLHKQSNVSEQSLIATAVIFFFLWAIILSAYVMIELNCKTCEMKAHRVCLACGYDLRGSPGGDCPECGEHKPAG